MNKIVLLIVMCLMALTMQAQRCAVLEFKAGVSISQEDVDGISAIFITYFRPAGYTMIERTQIDKVIEEQGFQRSKMTQAQMVRVGEILNVSKIVVGDINVVMGQYNVDARVINVETGTISATEGATFATSSYRTNMQSIATKLAAKIAITPGAPVKPTPSPNTASKHRSGVEVLYGYLKIFPNELGTFQAEPSTVIAQINKQAQHGYNNWRIPTNEELSLMKANNYIGSGEYMTRENRKGIVLLVSDGDDYATVQAAEQERKEELERKAPVLKALGFVDLGLPSGTFWKDKNETGGDENFFEYEQAVNQFGNNLPTKKQWEELKETCTWTWNGSGYKVTGTNGNSIVLPAAGYRNCDGNVLFVDADGDYWSSTPNGSNIWYLHFYSINVYMTYSSCGGRSVRLVQD